MIPRLPSPSDPTALPHLFRAELLARGFEGEITLGAADRTVMATDNSIYQVPPSAVAYPFGTDDLVRIAKILSEDRFASLHIAPRGGGTGTNGQSLTDGVVVDLSRFMNKIIGIDPATRTVRVQAGVVKDQLDAALKPYGLFFAPELSTSNRATIGGMISTDASGQGSCLYGKTRDHVLELQTVLTDGTVLESAALTPGELERAKTRPGRAGDIYRALDTLERENADLVADKFPKLNRCLTGYDLAHLRSENGRFDLNAVLCGSEGTLGFIAEATLNVIPIPRHTALVNMRYDSFDAALRDARALMDYGPASIETVDSKVLALAQGDLIWSDVADYFPQDGGDIAKGVNLIEFVAQSQDALDAALAPFENGMAGANTGSGRRGCIIARGSYNVDKIWDMRKRSVGLLGNMQGDKRPIAFVEDTAVPPENLADYIAEFRAALDRHGLEYGMFGHVDAGVLHVRPALDMKAEGAEALIRDITEEVVALTQKYGGLLWGEHGKGVRSEFSPRFFGPLYPAIQAVKRAFDPRNQFNPGKVAAPDGVALLKIDDVATKGQADRQIPPHLRDGTDNALHCNGNGACFNWDPDEAMCPSWKATRERRHSPKGRAQLMREWLRRLSAEGVDPRAEARQARRGMAILRFPRRLIATLARRDDDFSHEVHDAMNGCLACKSCTGKCPIKVNVPGFRAKFLELYYGRYLRPMRHHLVGRLETMIPVLAKIAPIANIAAASPLARLGGLVGTPKLTGVSLRRELARRGLSVATPDRLSRIDDADRSRHVVIVPDAFTAYYDTAVLLDTLDALRALGITPWVAPYRPNGKPLHVHGFLGAFERTARRHACQLEALAATGVDLVGIDPSMTLTYRSEYPAALAGQPRPKVQLIQEWLADRVADIRRPDTGQAQRYFLLPHCTERAIAPQGIGAWKTVFGACGMHLDILPAGCCGMAGTFGHEAENRALSEKIYGLSWSQHVNRPDIPQGALLADGFSCRCQAKLIDKATLRHPVQALAKGLGVETPS